MDLGLSQIDPGCVNTCAHEKRAELFSLLSCPGNRRQRFCFSNRLKSRRNFRSQIQFRRFHAAKTPQMSGVEVMDQTGKIIATGKAATGPANKKLLVVPVN